MYDKADDIVHIPILVEEVLYYLQPQPGQIILDCTVGGGGHAIKILDKIKPDGLLIGIDKDMEILKIAKQSLSKETDKFKLYHADYSDIDEVLRQANIDKVNGVLLDLGVSSLQFDQADRGFSFAKEAPLDMRMELGELLWKYGEERRSRRIARAILKEEKGVGITSTRQLAAIVERVVPRGKGKIHPATRVFQALRIAVNKELENLEIFLDKIYNYMAVGARIVIISFHSLEDRIVKNKFIEKAKQNIFRVLTKKPITPREAEMRGNIRSRSAKLRAAERI